MIRTKSIKDIAEASDGKRILVMRHWPQNFSRARLKLAEQNAWLPNLGPSIQLLKDWKAGNLAWRQYVARYLKEMENQRKAIAELAELAKTQTITLLCIEDEDNPHCHRHLLKNLVEQPMKEQEAIRWDNEGLVV